MRRGLALLVLGLGCGSDQPDPAPQELVVATWTGNLETDFALGFAERRTAVAQAVAKSEADVLCLTNVYRADDRARLRETATAFPYQAHVATDLATNVDDPTDQTGAIPAVPTEPACEGEALERLLDVGRCIARECYGDETNLHVRPTAGQCMEPCNLLQHAVSPWPRCLFCGRTLFYSSDATLAQIGEACATRTTTTAYDGNNDAILLSRHPLTDVGLHLVGATGHRVGFLRARVHKPGAAPTWVFCASLTRISINPLVPYTGPFGDGAETSPTAFAAENLLQTKKLVAHVRAVAGSEPAIVLGNFQASPPYPVDGLTHDGSIAAPSYAWLAHELVPAYAPEFAASCDRCAENPWSDLHTESFWYSHAFLHGLDHSAAVRTWRTFTSPVNGMTKPPSGYYGIATRIRLPPP